MKKMAFTDRQSISLPLTLLPPTLNSAIAPLQPAPEKLNNAWERLTALVQNINHLAAELETKILELKAIASNINSQINYLTDNGKQSHSSVCQYSSVSIPWVKQKPDDSFILTTKKVDLFKAEREAALLAQQLRKHTYKKNVAKQHQRKNRR